MKSVMRGGFCRRSSIAIALAAMLVGRSMSSFAAGPSHPSDVAAVIGFLLRVHEGACPGISFDPLVMSKMIDPKGISLDLVKRRFRKKFDVSYAEAGSRIAVEGVPAYCELVRSFFGKTPGEFPGLTIQ
ncbi:hypothetical protein [Terrarubrum flagellatum]|uniref:hypothetical protein n=1 Tax=Terrirubrum flagellatum TaxID=2895980 RepID=UPI0031455E4D